MEINFNEKETRHLKQLLEETRIALETQLEKMQGRISRFYVGRIVNSVEEAIRVIEQKIKEGRDD